MSFDCLARLEKAMLERANIAGTPTQNGIDSARYVAVNEMLIAIRAAQRSEAGPETYTNPMPQGFAVPEPVGPHCVFIPRDEWTALRAWEKWAREAAVPAMDKTLDARVDLRDSLTAIGKALASRPKEP